MRRLASVMFGLGVVIGTVGAVGLALGFRPSDLPADLLDISVYKLVFIASAVVLGLGAVLRRASRRKAFDESRPPSALSDPTEAERLAALADRTPRERIDVKR